MSTGLREFAECPARFVEVPLHGSAVRADDERRCVVRGRSWAEVSAIRIGADAVDDLVEEVRGMLPDDCTALWHLGPSSRPMDLLEQLQRRGLTAPAHRPSEVRALALAEEPESPTEVEVRPVEGFEEFATAREVAWDAFNAPEARRAVERAELRADFDELERCGLPVLFVGFLEGRLAGSAVAVPSPRGVLLGGGSVASWARGRGLYRALVAARWEYAAARGTPALVTHANPGTSYPILLRLGFTEIGTIHRLEDRARPER